MSSADRQLELDLTSPPQPEQPTPKIVHRPGRSKTAHVFARSTRSNRNPAQIAEEKRAFRERLANRRAWQQELAERFVDPEEVAGDSPPLADWAHAKLVTLPGLEDLKPDSTVMRLVVDMLAAGLRDASQPSAHRVPEPSTEALLKGPSPGSFLPFSFPEPADNPESDRPDSDQLDSDQLDSDRPISSTSETNADPDDPQRGADMQMRHCVIPATPERPENRGSRTPVAAPGNGSDPGFGIAIGNTAKSPPRSPERQAGESTTADRSTRSGHHGRVEGPGP